MTIADALIILVRLQACEHRLNANEIIALDKAIKIMACELIKYYMESENNDK
jgi:hypothetical protein